jgi:hypothetical protein
VIALVPSSLLCQNTAMIIPLSNGDGIHSEGIIALANSLQPVGEMYTV